MKKLLFSTILCFVMLYAGTAMAHSPVMSCFDNGDETITCEGGFSDGSSAAGVNIIVSDGSGKNIIQGKMNMDGEYTFKKPAGEYKVTFDAGEGHQIIVDGKNIVE